SSVIAGSLAVSAMRLRAGSIVAARDQRRSFGPMSRKSNVRTDCQGAAPASDACPVSEPSRSNIWRCIRAPVVPSGRRLPKDRARVKRAVADASVVVAVDVARHADLALHVAIAHVARALGADVECARDAVDGDVAGADRIDRDVTAGAGNADVAR